MCWCMRVILSHVPPERQTLLFCATMPVWVKKVRVCVAVGVGLNTMQKQEIQV